VPHARLHRRASSSGCERPASRIGSALDWTFSPAPPAPSGDPALGAFSNLTAADTAVRATFVGALRFVRYSIAVTGAGPAYVTVNGFARTTV
jgi:hypothetical protein